MPTPLKEICKRLLLLIPGILFLIIIDCRFLLIQEPYRSISWLAICLLAFILCIGADKFSFGTGSLQFTLEKANATQRELEGSLETVMKITAKIAYSENHKDLSPDRTYIYNLIHKILKNPFYSEAEKKELIQDCKWVLLKWLFERLQVELKENFKNNEPLEDNLRGIKNNLKDILNSRKYNFYWLRCKIINLKDKSILNTLSEKERKAYKGIIKAYQKIIENFICNSFIPEDFLISGERK